MRTYKIAPGTLMQVAQLQQSVNKGYSALEGSVRNLLRRLSPSDCRDQLIRLVLAANVAEDQGDRIISWLREGDVSRQFLIMPNELINAIHRAAVRPGAGAVNDAEWQHYVQWVTNLVTQQQRIYGMVQRLQANGKSAIANGPQKRYIETPPIKTVSGDLSNLMQTIINQLGAFHRLYTESWSSSNSPSAKLLERYADDADSLLPRANLIQQLIQKQDWRYSTASYAHDLANIMSLLTNVLGKAAGQQRPHGNVPSTRNLAALISGRCRQMARMLGHQVKINYGPR